MQITPTQEIYLDILTEKEIRLFIKRDDLTHPLVSGNKWRKMKYNIIEAKKQGCSTLLSFGGAFSNHIHALAAIGKTHGFKTIGIIRGEACSQSNPTLSSAISMGMELHFISRETYKQKDDPEYLETLATKFGKCYIIPEGGTNTLALKGCEEIISETKNQIEENIDYWTVACGTAGTISGMIQGLHNQQEIIGFSALKGDFHKKDIQNLLNNDNFTNWEVITSYHFGGYAKYKPELISFINEFKEKTEIQLEPIYNGKMMFGLLDLIKQDYFPKKSNIVAIHTGGLQGIKGFNQRFGNVLK